MALQCGRRAISSEEDPLCFLWPQSEFKNWPWYFLRKIRVLCYHILVLRFAENRSAHRHQMIKVTSRSPWTPTTLKAYAISFSPAYDTHLSHRNLSWLQCIFQGIERVHINEEVPKTCTTTGRGSPENIHVRCERTKQEPRRFLRGRGDYAQKEHFYKAKHKSSYPKCGNP